MSLPPRHLRDVDPTPGGAEVVTVTLCDKTFQAGARTAAHISHTRDEVQAQFPGSHLHIMQTCYHSGYAPSAGTHDYDGVLDFRLEGRDHTLAEWWALQYALRELGWDGYFRHTGDWADPETWHVHAVSEGCPGPVGYYVPGQVADYVAHALGLAGEHIPGEDTSRFPPDIAAVRFDYQSWKDANMPLNDADLAKVKALIEAAIPEIVDAVLAAPVGGANDPASVKQALNQSRNRKATP